jgi:hypothetical protein
MRIFGRILLYLVLVAGVGFVGFALFSELTAPQHDVEVPVEAK